MKTREVVIPLEEFSKRLLEIGFNIKSLKCRKFPVFLAFKKDEAKIFYGESKTTVIDLA